jgi:hypothetical protein
VAFSTTSAPDGIGKLPIDPPTLTVLPERDDLDEGLAVAE